MKPARTISILLFSLLSHTWAHGGSVWPYSDPVAARIIQGDPAPRNDSTVVQAAVSEKDLEGTVEVSFRINSEGKAQILNIQASNPKLIDYVVKKLNKIQLAKAGTGSGQVIKYRFVFKKQA